MQAIATTFMDAWAAIPPVVWVLAYVIWLVAAAAYILLQRRSPTATLAWLIGFVALPLLGFIVYHFFGPRKLKRRKLRREVARHLASRHTPRARPPLPKTLASRHWLTSLARLGIQYEDPPPRPNAVVRMLIDGDDTYAAIEAAMAKAQRHIHMEYYIYEPDDIGKRWRDLLAERARAGVKVRVLVDAVGSKNCKRQFWKPLTDAGGEVRQFNPLRLLTLSGSLANFRTHRKIVIIDGEQGFTGGINVSAGSSVMSSGSSGWRDTHLEIVGASVQDLQSIFLEDWLYGGSGPQRRSGLRELQATPADIKDWFPELPQPDDGVWLQVIDSGPDESVPSLHRFMFTAIASARSRIWLTTPYFVPDEPMMTALATAHARGVDVRIIVPSEGDSWFVSRAASTYAEEIAGEGVAVYEYLPRMMHAKTLVIDDELSVVGTANFDNRSFRLNFEVVAAIYDAGFTRQLAEVFERDLADCEPLDLEARRSTVVQRLLASKTRLAAPLL